MQQRKSKTEIRMFSNGRAKILKKSSNDGMREFLVRVFSDFYNDYKESLRLSSRRTYANRREMLAERIQITPSGERRIDRAMDRAEPIARRMARMVKRSLIPFKSLRVFHPVGDIQKNYAAIVSYVRAMYDSVYEMVEDAGLPDPHPVALAAAKVACNFIITIKTAILVHKLSDADVMEAQAEAGVDEIEEPVDIDESRLREDVRLQINSLVGKYRAIYRLLGITQAIPATTQQIKRIVLATLATQRPDLNIPDTIYAAGSFAYNTIISRLTEHILRDKIEAHGGGLGFSATSGAQSQTVAQSKKPRRFSDIVNTSDEYDAEEPFEEESKDENLALDLVYDEDEELDEEEFIEPEETDDYEEDYEELDYDEDYDEDEYEDEDEDYEELDEELDESQLEQAVADVEVSAQSKRLARKFASENPEGFDDYDELKRKLYSFIIRNLFRHRYFSDEKAEDEAKEHIADIVDRLESIEEKLGSLEEAVEKVVEASTALVEDEESSEEEDDKFDLFLENSKEEDEEDTDDSEKESEEETEGEDESEEDDEEKENSEEEEKSQSKVSRRYAELVSKKKNHKRPFSDEEEMDEMLEKEKKRFRKLFSDEESETEGFFSRKLKQSEMKRRLKEGKSKRYGRSPKKKDINVVDIIFKLQKNRKKGLRK